MVIVRTIFVYSIRVLLLVVTLIGLVIAGEYTTRYIFRDITTTGDNGSYFAKKWRLEQFGRGNPKYNSWGFREREIDQAAPENTFRIAVIGDSITYGQGVPDEERFTNRLERALTDTGKQFQDLNFGIAGANHVHHIRTMRKILKTSPDFTLLQWYVNDFEGSKPKNRPRYRNLAPTMKLHKQLHQQSALYYVLNMGWHALQEYMGIVGSYEQYMHDRFLDPNSESYKKEIANFEKILRIASSSHVPIGIVLFPRLRPSLIQGYPFDYLHERIISICQENKIPYVDLREDFKSFGPDIRVLHVNRYDSHPNGRANEIVTKRMLEVFGPLWQQMYAMKTNEVKEADRS